MYAYCLVKVAFKLREKPVKEPSWSEMVVEVGGAM